MAGRQWNYGEPEPECFHQGGLEISEIFKPQNWFTRRGVYTYVDIHTHKARTIWYVRLLLQIAIFVWLSFFLIFYFFWSASHGAVAGVEMFCFSVECAGSISKSPFPSLSSQALLALPSLALATLSTLDSKPGNAGSFSISFTSSSGTLLPVAPKWLGHGESQHDETKGVSCV